MPRQEETVASLVSPSGVGGVSIIQVVGPTALEVTRPFLRNRANDQPPQLNANRLRLVRWMDQDEHIDDVVVVINDFTSAAPTVCINSHGSIRVVERILMCLERAGVCIQHELPVEQMWENLSSIEAAVMKHLPHAKTKQVARWLISQIVTLSQSIHQCVDWLECGDTELAAKRLRRLLDTYPMGNLLLEGARVVILGPPNAGKSTLANRLFDKPWSIESEEPGTTRDWVQHPIAIEGVPLMLADTAGLRQTDDELEALAIQKSHPIIQAADVQILVLDASSSACELPQAWLTYLLHKDKLVIALNKADLGTCPPEFVETFDAVSSAALAVSALRNEGLDELRKVILRTLHMADGKLPVCSIWDSEHEKFLKDVLTMTEENRNQAAGLLRDKFLTKLA